MHTRHESTPNGPPHSLGHLPLHRRLQPRLQIMFDPPRLRHKLRHHRQILRAWISYPPPTYHATEVKSIPYTSSTDPPQPSPKHPDSASSASYSISCPPSRPDHTANTRLQPATRAPAYATYPSPRWPSRWRRRLRRALRRRTSVSAPRGRGAGAWTSGGLLSWRNGRLIANVRGEARSVGRGLGGRRRRVRMGLVFGSWL